LTLGLQAPIFAQMGIEYGGNSEIENIFGKNGFPILSPEEVIKHTVLVSQGRLDTLKPGQIFELDKEKNNVNIIVTGDSRWGKTTATTIAMLEVSCYQIPLRIEREISENSKPYDLRWDDGTAMRYNFGYALSGLSRIVKNWSLEGPQINIYERGFIDHVVFAEALNKWYGDVSSYKEVVDAFRTFYGFYLGYIDGIILCTSTQETTTKNGSTLPQELTALLSEGYKNFPATLSKITKGKQIDPIPIIQLQFEELGSPVQTLKRSIYTMLKWNLDGEVVTNPTESN
jgi:hypothetical protein